MSKGGNWRKEMFWAQYKESRSYRFPPKTYPGGNKILTEAYMAWHALGPCTASSPLSMLTFLFALFWLPSPLNPLPMFEEFTTLPDLASLHRTHSFSSPSFIRSRKDIKWEWLKNWQCLTQQRGDCGGVGWVKETIDEDLAKYLKSGKWKKAVA